MKVLHKTAIAVHLGFSKSTINREFKRNVPKRWSGAKIYVAEKAHIKTVNRHRFKPKAICYNEPMKERPAAPTTEGEVETEHKVAEEVIPESPTDSHTPEQDIAAEENKNLDNGADVEVDKW